jgi:hypothetical protein
MNIQIIEADAWVPSQSESYLRLIQEVLGQAWVMAGKSHTAMEMKTISCKSASKI